jgi:hypothetical protein
VDRSGEVNRYHTAISNDFVERTDCTGVPSTVSKSTEAFTGCPGGHRPSTC